MLSKIKKHNPWLYDKERTIRENEGAAKKEKFDIDVEQNCNNKPQKWGSNQNEIAA